jgi:poly(3-hydroxybutyrate) depolymerase
VLVALAGCGVDAGLGPGGGTGGGGGAAAATGEGSDDAGAAEAGDAGAGSRDGEAGSLDDRPPLSFSRIPGVTTNVELPAEPDTFANWERDVPGIQDVRIRSTADGSVQPALWLAPSGDTPAPLLVVLHSWSTRYLQHGNAPFGQFARQQGWAMVAPDYRGVFETPEATGSDLAVQDVLDAVDHAVERGADPDRVFVVGFSGGAMMSLLLAGRHPDRFAAAAAWVGIHDLVDWYRYNVDRRATTYARQIRASCGGDPLTDPGAREQCEQRSPAAHLDAAREAGIPVYLGAGLQDVTVPADHGLRSYNQLVGPDAAVAGDVVRTVADGRLPGELVGSVEAETYFRDGDPEVLFARSHGPVTVVLFEGAHEMVYNPGLEWMTEVG